MENVLEHFYQRFCKVGLDRDGVLNYFEPVVPENFNFGYDVVDEIARLAPDHRALLWRSQTGEERDYTFADICRMTNKAANLFLSLGIRKGDRVMLVLKRHYQFWFSIVALHKIGAVVIPATHMLTKKDYLYRFEAAGVTAIVCAGDGDVTLHADQACAEYPGVTVKLATGGPKEGWLDFDALLEQADDQLERAETLSTDPMLLYFTSGTTGYPKMVVHDFSYPIGHIITARYWHNLRPDSLHLTVADTGWGKAVWGKLYGQWLCGAGVFVYDYEKFNPSDLLHMIEQYRITSFCAPPTIYRFFIKEGMEHFDLSSLEYATTAGEALNPEVYNRFLEYTGLKLMEGFGQTETVLMTANLAGSVAKPGSMGRPSPLFSMDIVDEDGHSLPAGEVGEIVIRTPEDQRHVGLFSCYYNDEERKAQVWHDGLYHTGDTAWRDEDGYYWYVGRTDDVIKASGYRIGPFEIESVLMQHPAVMECAVTGAPDPIRGTVVKATIVLTKTYQPSDTLTKELQTYVKEQTAPYKYPRVIEYVPELPKTISGKIRRVELREKDAQRSR
ncbi:MAG TPA: AMP-binding protein [Firmicutes bacterium]|nr:AMP-binding protein [Bacillota bacterium]